MYCTPCAWVLEWVRCADMLELCARRVPVDIEEGRGDILGGAQSTRESRNTRAPRMRSEATAWPCMPMGVVPCAAVVAACLVVVVGWGRWPPCSFGVGRPPACVMRPCHRWSPYTERPCWCVCATSCAVHQEWEVPGYQVHEEPLREHRASEQSARDPGVAAAVTLPTHHQAV